MTMWFKRSTPFIILTALLFFLAYELFYAKPHEIASPLIGEPLPEFHLATLSGQPAYFSNRDLPHHPFLINVWATWCYACQIEHPTLMKIAQQSHTRIYSIDYKDEPRKAQQYLQQNGNPYEVVLDDRNGDVAIDFGVYGTPETFVVDAQGKIVYKHIGVLDENAWEKTIHPLLEKLAKEAV